MKKLLVIGICILLFPMLISCRSREKSGLREIYIPVLADNAWLTADGTFIDGVRLAAQELNTAYSGKGFIIKTDVIDDKALYETGVEMATKLAGENAVTAVFNLQNFDVSKTTAGILAGSGKLTIFPYGAYDSLFSKDNQYLFCSVPSFSDLGKAMADHTVKIGYKRIAVYHNGKQSQEELVTAFELALLNSGTKVVDYVPSITSSSEFDSIYNRWKLLGVDCVVISQYGLDRAFDILNMLRSRDSKIAVIGEPIFNRANALSENKAISEGMAVPSTLVIEDSNELKAFKVRFRKKYGNDADIWAVQGYDMMRLVVDTAVRLDTNDPAKIAAALHDERGYQGIGRRIAFSKGGALATDANKLPILYCRNGRFE